MDKMKRFGTNSYSLIVATITHVLTHIFSGIHTTVFGLLRDEFKLTIQQLGLIASIPPFIDAILAIPAGLISDRIGSKNMMLLSFCFAVAGALLAGVSTSPLILVVAVCFIYINTTIYHPASYSFTTRIFGRGDRSKALGLHGAGGLFGHAMGPLAVSLLVGVLAWQWRQVYLILIIPLIIGIFMVFFLKAEPDAKPDAEKLKGSVDSQKFITTSLVMFLVYSSLRSMGGSMISTFLVLYLQDIRGMGITAASLIISGTTISGLLSAPIGGFVASRLGDKKWLEVSQLFAFILLGLSFNSPNNTLFSILYLSYGLGSNLGMAARNSIMASLTPHSKRGLGFSLFFLPGSIIGAVAPIIASQLAQTLGFSNIFNLALLINFSSLAVLKYFVKIK